MSKKNKTKRKSTKGESPFADKIIFNEAVSCCHAIFIPWLSGDGQYEKPESNVIALEAMICAWCMSRPWFGELLEHLGTAAFDQDTYLVLHDFACEVAQTATTSTLPQFSCT